MSKRNKKEVKLENNAELEIHCMESACYKAIFYCDCSLIDWVSMSDLTGENVTVHPSWSPSHCWDVAGVGTIPLNIRL